MKMFEAISYLSSTLEAGNAFVVICAFVYAVLWGASRIYKAKTTTKI